MSEENIDLEILEAERAMQRRIAWLEAALDLAITLIQEQEEGIEGTVPVKEKLRLVREILGGNGSKLLDAIQAATKALEAQCEWFGLNPSGIQSPDVHTMAVNALKALLPFARSKEG